MPGTNFVVLLSCSLFSKARISIVSPEFKHFFTKHCQMMNIPLKEFTSSALDCLTRYSWPGNTRQLENEIKRPIATVRPKVITEEQLNLQTESLRKETQEEELSRRGQSLNDAVEALERHMIEEAILKCNGNKQKAAQLLGLSRQGLVKKVKRLGVAAFCLVFALATI
jgi:DNA-binding NtrC family response regulator